MTLLIGLLLVALAIVAWYRHQSPSPILNAMVIVLALACVGALVFEWRRPKMEAVRYFASVDRVQEAIGFELGHAIAQSFPQGGDVLVLLKGMPAEFPEEGSGAAQLKGLRAGFGQGNLRAIPVGYTPGSDQEAMEMSELWPRRGVPFEKISEWFAGHHGAVAVVSFILVGTGPSGNQPTQMPPLFVLSPPAMGLGPEEKNQWVDWVKPGALEAVAVSRNGFDWKTVASPRELADVFSNCCELITPANVAEARPHLVGDKR